MGREVGRELESKFVLLCAQRRLLINDRLPFVWRKPPSSRMYSTLEMLRTIPFDAIFLSLFRTLVLVFGLNLQTCELFPTA